LKDKCSFIVFSEEWRHLSGEWLDSFLNMRKEYEFALETMFGECLSSGKIKKLNIQIGIQTLLSATRWVHYSNKQKSRFSADEIKHTISEILLKGLLIH